MLDGAPTAEVVREHLERILASSLFRASESLRRLLRYTVEAALAGRGETLKEYTVGVEGLGRPASFDPHQDTIVRAQAWKLRERLAAYYATEGSSDTHRIVYRPGSYQPVFTTEQPVPAAAVRTVAVLPFMNLTADGSAAYFCDGLAEELIDLLTRSEGLRVVARTSSFRFRGSEADVREIGQRLGADLLIEGAVRGDSDRYRITVRLLSAVDGYEVWASRYDRKLRDILELETEIAAAIASSLTSGTPPTCSATDPEGALLYMQARYAWNHRTETGIRRALALYSAATGRDSRAAKAWSGIAECHVILNMHGLARPHDCMPQAREAAKMAIAIDPGLASAWSALAAITILYDRNYEAAEEQFRKALELDPAYATAHHWHATLVFLRSRKMGQALDEMREAERLEPLSAAIANDTGFVLYRDRQFDEAAEQARRTIVLHPGFYRSHALLGRIYCAQGKYSDAVRACLKARELVEDGSFLPFLLGTLGYAHASSGNWAAARQILEELLALEQRLAPTGHERALVATALGDFDDAVRALNTAFALHAGWMVWVHVEPLFEPLRARGLLTDTSFT